MRENIYRFRLYNNIKYKTFKTLEGHRYNLNEIVQFHYRPSSYDPRTNTLVLYCSDGWHVRCIGRILKSRLTDIIDKYKNTQLSDLNSIIRDHKE